MANVVRIPVLFAAFLAIHTAQAADPATGTEPVVSRSAPAADGALLFATHCAMCHKPVTLARRLQSAPDLESAKAGMSAFLIRHGRSDAAADAAIIDYLANGAAP